MNEPLKKRLVVSVSLGLFGAGFALFSFASCNSVLGIEDAVQGLPFLSDTKTRATCASYCGTVIRNCTGPNAEYIDVAERDHVCQAACTSSNWDDNDPGTTTGNSLACRATHAVLAKGDPATHCQAAGLVGGGVCGDYCTAFCQATEPYCGAYAFDGGVDECSAACAKFVYHTGVGASDISEPGDDTLNCRIYHLENAYRDETAREFHCGHTKAVSAACVPPADASVDGS